MNFTLLHFFSLFILEQGGFVLTLAIDTELKLMRRYHTLAYLPNIHPHVYMARNQWRYIS